ncbi:TnsA endonuclease N-terminal domain-containing protein [Arcobacter cryaerophilus gv. pseudocryaerophilus]|uniref:TnsA endonuclease N-terminal domain-containing protein n=3 Tax=unclassified Arcobacter TaxID=2593671 RepID=A0AA96IEH6_9BACT|nr:TnsA endonuclease N-terminal domain-containing protein [Arcobacter sp. AZ-2023]WPD06085.1 TnsA endonuclease N-terminal domain-containing protein [Arcobacter sp. DSM 115956]WPD08177.1 TnsA endonuclease N-terminal domain-containing protein [Arcobacter sp. DSM 115955]WNL32442.1 TnsA endonuclease N-terminal domain-containing protein [Arcobacter sp. AZ-2023]WNP38592.1 TnsA endonuclease N-terminal domain-containing protein [Arcobacter sp. AZ-2023]
MSTRKIKKSHIAVSGYFASYKNKRQINFESKLEHDFYLLLEFDEQVKSYKEQPFNIYYTYQDKKRRYTPDTLVNYIDDTQKVFEVKPIFKIQNDIELQEKIKLQKQKIKEEKNLELSIFTDSNIDKIYMDNIKIIYNFAFIKENKEIEDKIKNELLKLNIQIQIKELLDRITNNQSDRLKYIPYIWNLVFNNPRCVDFTKKITMASIINPKGLI